MRFGSVFILHPRSVVFREIGPNSYFTANREHHGSTQLVITWGVKIPQAVTTAWPRLADRIIGAFAVIRKMCQGSKGVTQVRNSVAVETVDAKRASLPRWAITLRALRHRNFQLFFGGQLISLTVTWMQNVAQAWLVYRLTGSALLLGAAGFASQIPVFLIAPLGGIAADRTNRQRLVIATQTASMTLAAILAWLALSGRVQVWHIFVLASMLGVVNAFDIPGRQSFLVDMVGKDDLMNAIALNSSMFNGARVIGPAVAGMLVARLGEGWCFFANGASYIAVIAGLMM